MCVRVCVHNIAVVEKETISNRAYSTVAPKMFSFKPFQKLNQRIT